MRSDCTPDRMDRIAIAFRQGLADGIYGTECDGEQPDRVRRDAYDAGINLGIRMILGEFPEEIGPAQAKRGKP